MAEMESEEKGGGEEREATPQSAAADSSPYTGEPRTTLLSLLWETSYPLIQGNQGAFCLIRGGTWRLGERHRRL